MRHAGGVADEAFHSTQTFRKGEQLKRTRKFQGLFAAAVQLKHDQARTTGHLLHGERVLRVAGKMRIAHRADSRLVFKPFGKAEGVMAVCLHTQAKRTGAAGCQPGIKRGGLKP